jgi:hypothetical protein
LPRRNTTPPDIDVAAAQHHAAGHRCSRRVAQRSFEFAGLEFYDIRITHTELIQQGSPGQFPHRR